MIADSLVNLGEFIVANTGESLKKDLDRVCVEGSNASGEPIGILNSGITNTIPSAMGSNGQVNISDAENALFGIGKQYRTATMRPAFISTDGTYQRFRATPVGPNDARRIFGLNEGSYECLNWPWRVYQGMSESKLIYGCLARYRMYRRQGAEMSWTIDGQTLALKNEAFSVYRGRYGGRVVDTNAFAIVDNLGTA